MRCRRPGVTLVEMLVATAMIVTLLFAVMALLRRGFLDGGDLAGRETADTLSRNLLERFYALPRADIERILASGERGGDVGSIEDDTLHGVDARSPGELLAAGFLRELRAGTLRGFQLGSLRTRVGWRDPSGRRRFLSHGRYSLMPSGMPEGLKQASGFTEAKQVPAWGRSREWSEVAAGVLGDEEPAGLPPAVQRRNELRKLLAFRARHREYHPPAGDRQALRFRGDPAQVAGYLGAGGRMAARQSSPERVRRHQAARQVRRFLRRARIPDLDLKPSPVPDGEYRARLEALDLRGEARGRVLGVYELIDAQEQSYTMVGQLRAGPPMTRSLEGDLVLERRALRDARGQPWWLARTEIRLYLIGMTPDLVARRLVIQTLGVGDLSPSGRPTTHDEVARLLAARDLVPADTAPPDELLEALGVTAVPGGAEAYMAAPNPEPTVAAGAGAVGRRCASGPDGTCSLRVTERPVVVTGAPAMEAPNPYRPASWVRRGGARDPLGQAHERALSDPRAALRLLDSMLEEDGRLEAARLLRARVRADVGDLDGALLDLDALARDPHAKPEVLRDYAGILLRARRLDEAAQAIAVFARRAPEDPLVWTFQESLKLARADAAAGVGPRPVRRP